MPAFLELGEGGNGAVLGTLGQRRPGLQAPQRPGPRYQLRDIRPLRLASAQAGCGKDVGCPVTPSLASGTLEGRG